MKKLFFTKRSFRHHYNFIACSCAAGFLIFIASITGCKKNTDQIAPANVDFYIYLTEPSFQSLNTVGNYVYVTGGVKGIIVYHKSIDEFVAYERSCPYDPNVSGAIIAVDSSGLGLIDYTCGSRYNILDGSIVNGPTAYPLRQYYCEYDGISSLHIHN